MVVIQDHGDGHKFSEAESVIGDLTSMFDRSVKSDTVPFLAPVITIRSGVRVELG